MPDAVHLSATWFLDYHHPSVSAFIQSAVSENMSDGEKISTLYLAIRDGFRYDPYRIDFQPEGFKSSNLCSRDHGYCVEKAGLYAACLRAVGIPSRLFFGDVRNHIGVDRLQKILGTDRLIFHGSTEVWNGKDWVKATPAFNQELCDLLGVEPLEFDGSEDSIFQPHDKRGKRFMEYLEEHGSFDDVPYDRFMDAMEEGYNLKGIRGMQADLRTLDHWPD